LAAWGFGSGIGSDDCEGSMKTLSAMIVCLSLIGVAGCQSRSTAEVDAVNARLQAEQAKSVELTKRADDATAAKANAEKHVAELSTALEAAKKQVGEEKHNAELIQAQLVDAQKAQSAAEDRIRQAVADSDLLKARLAQRGTLRNIDDTVPLDATVPEEIRNAFRSALAWRANQVRSLEIEIRDTPSRADAKAMKTRLDKLRSSPLTPPNLVPANLTLGQIGPLEIDDHLRIDEVTDDTTLVVTPIKIDPSITPQITVSASGAIGSAVVREEGNPIAIHGFPTKGAVTGAKLTALPGLYFVEKTQRYGSRTIFVLAPVDPNKMRAYFVRLQAELRAQATSTPHDSAGEGVAK
jgi:hypothetical protein